MLYIILCHAHLNPDSGRSSVFWLDSEGREEKGSRSGRFRKYFLFQLSLPTLTFCPVPGNVPRPPWPTCPAVHGGAVQSSD